MDCDNEGSSISSENINRLLFMFFDNLPEIKSSNSLRSGRIGTKRQAGWNEFAFQNMLTYLRAYSYCIY